jgi:hypothetical protein
MKDYLFIFRTDYNMMPQRTPDEAAKVTQKWIDWIGSIAEQGKLSDRGNRLALSGKVVRSNQSVTNGPYMEIKESIGGYSLVKASSYEEAIALASNCPILSVGGNVEVRELDPL